jgi:alpha-tubulin suppressor-like RCC1 family protein
MNCLSKFAFFIVVGFCCSQPVLAVPATAIAAGVDHACALTNTGGVECWGVNAYGELGNGTTNTSFTYTPDYSYTPVNVIGLSSGETAVAAGGDHTCALTTAGGVQCWGYNYYGELGNGTSTTSSTPVDVTGLSSGVTAIATGYSHSCALTNAGGVECWGDNVNGELGNGTVSSISPVPVNVTGLSSGVTAIAAGWVHTCALTNAGGVECWGDNGNGQLGDGTTTDSSTQVNVTGLSSGVTAIAGGNNFTCAVTSSGGVECWGVNNFGQLGNGTGTDSYIPVNVTGLSSGVTAITAGGSLTCAVTSSSEVQCWGDNGGYIGNGQFVDSTTPVDVAGLSDVVAISAGTSYICAITSSNQLKCLGLNDNGELGNGTRINRATPAAVVGLGAAAIKNDFNGDGKSDVLFLNSSTGSTKYWNDASKSQSIYVGTSSADYSYAGSGDFDGDGKADLFFTKASNRATLVLSGAVKTATTYPGTSTAGFNLAAICDVNGDGKDDVVWFNPTTGGTQIWHGAVKASITYPGTQAADYSVAACADFDGDGKADVFWHNNATGANQIWLSANKSTKLYPGTSGDLTWLPFGAGDIDGDGKADMVWYRASNNGTMVWKGGLKSAISYPGTGTSGFTPKAIGDYNGDGKADMFWANDSTLATQIWPDVVKSAMTYPGAYPTGFTIQK